MTRVESVRAYVLRAPRAAGPRAATGYLRGRTVDTVLVRVRTRDGMTGWGECKASVAPQVCATLVDEVLAPLVAGTSLAEIAPTWERMYAGMRVRGHDSGFWLEAMAGVDIALWDAWARILGQPVWALLGGRFREEVPVYAASMHAAPADSGAAGLRAVEARAHDLADQGFHQVKVTVGAPGTADLASVAVVRDVLADRFGADHAVYVDAAGSYDVRRALVVGERLAELGVGFFEMPVPPERVHDYVTLARRLAVPLALDSLATRHRALQFLRAGALHVLQPDVCRAGGITETVRIAVLAEAFGAQTTPHVSTGSAVHLAASLQCAVAMPACPVLEHPVGDNPLGRAVAADLDAPTDGRRRVTDRPGLGITVDETAAPFRTLA